MNPYEPKRKATDPPPRGDEERYKLTKKESDGILKGDRAIIKRLREECWTKLSRAPELMRIKLFHPSGQVAGVFLQGEQPIGFRPGDIATSGRTAQEERR